MNQAGATLLGRVADVTGSSVRVKQVKNLASGVATIAGRSYRAGQVGSFARIPQGYMDLFGVIEQVGSGAVPKNLAEEEEDSLRWLKVQLLGESVGGNFERGLSQHPSVGDEVHLVTEDDLHQIYGTELEGQVEVGHLASSESIPVRLDLNRLVTRHSAILGSTGSGKSTTIATLLRSVAAENLSSGLPAFPNSRILLFDVHGEYAKALDDISTVFRINASGTEQELFIPFWALAFDELKEFLTGGIGEDKEMHLGDKILELKRRSLDAYSFPGASPRSLTLDTPIPYSLKQLWYELINEELKTLEGEERDQPARIGPGDANTLSPPTYKPWTPNRTVVLNPHVPGIRRQLDHLRSRLLDRRFDFLLHPGDWDPDLKGKCEHDLDSLLHRWLGHREPITIIDLSGVPSSVLTRLIGAVLRIVYDALFWSRDKSEGGVERPMLIVMEEAHSYLAKGEDSPAATMARRIAKEGRKYGIGCMVVSQRPSEVEDTILSQCGTFITLRLSNSRDREQIRGTVPDSLAGFMEMLPILRTGEALITGEAVRLPMRVRVALPPSDRRPDSEDPEVARRWQEVRLPEDYGQVVAALRAQSPRAVKEDVTIERKPVEDDDSWRRAPSG